MREAWMFLILASNIAAESYYFPSAQLSTTWTNKESSLPSINFTDGSRIRIILNSTTEILLNSTTENLPTFMCGFICNGACTSYLFAIVINLFTVVDPDQVVPLANQDFLEVIWSANRDDPVKEGAILNFTAGGDLVLKDVDGSIAWTTNTNKQSIVTMNLTCEGNLGLFDIDNSMVWQSFDHPTDCLVSGQKLFQGQKLIPSVSSTDWAAQKDLFSLQPTDKGLFAYFGSNPPQVYYHNFVDGISPASYVEYNGRSLCFFIFSTRPNYCKSVIDIPSAPDYPFQYIKLFPYGHLKVLGWDALRGRVEVADLLTGELGECSYPLACGRNAICSDNEECSCPGIDSFRAVDDFQPNMGCSEITPLRCNATQDQHFIELKNIKSFNYTADIENVNRENCTQACLDKCSCRLALFEYGLNSSSGNCYLPSEFFTITRVDAGLLPYNTSAFIKVQNVTSSKHKVAKVLSFTIGSFLLLVVVCFTMFIVRKKKRDSEIEEEYLDQVPGMPTRFSYQQLKAATENFTKKLGEGGFGSVFEGTLEDGSMIAVKCLEGLVHLKKSFQAEVESIGSIHHVNLVRLRGFCAWNSERLLVYEFMSNGSLDQWIYNGDRKSVLSWGCRKKIILDIAKGLAYLHEECRQKIIHLDIKPQNILLDEEFNAKVSDFGLSKLIDRDQSQVITRMRGTPGYMAPECVGSCITEKVDVYSFGIVVLEMLSGRKNFDRSEPEEDWHLVSVFQRCWGEERLLDIVDRSSEDMQVHGAEVMEMMKVASWCLQTDFTRRPSMSTVVKVLDGVMNVETNLDYNFTYPRLQETTSQHENSSNQVLPSILSGPR